MNFRNQSGLVENSSFIGYTSFPKRQDWFWVSLGFICVVTTVGNILVLFLICSKRSFRNKVSPNWFILSLGVADLLIGSFNIPVQFVCSFTRQCSHLSTNIMYCLISFFLTASTTNVCLLTFDIYLAVFHPFWYPNLMSRSNSRVLIIMCWFLTAILNIAMFISALNPTGSIDAERADQGITLLFYVLSSLFLTYVFGRILLVVRSHKKDIAKHERQLESNTTSREFLTDRSHSTPSSRVRKRNRDGTITATGVVTASFLVCNGIWMYRLVHFILPKQIPMNRTLIDVTHLVVYCNCTMNFIVYALLRNDLRGEFESYFKKFYRKKNENQTTSLSQMRQANRQTDTLILPSTKADPEQTRGSFTVVNT